MEILDVGCGWGSLSLWIAESFPSASSWRSRTPCPRESSSGPGRELSLGNVEVTTADMNRFDTNRRFDRILSVEMFEHMRNWERLLERISGWLNKDGKLFIHIFTHHRLSYLSKPTARTTGWGAISSRQADAFGRPASLFPRSSGSGGALAGERIHYQKTAEAWLREWTRGRGSQDPFQRSLWCCEARSGFRDGASSSWPVQALGFGRKGVDRFPLRFRKRFE